MSLICSCSIIMLGPTLHAYVALPNYVHSLRPRSRPECICLITWIEEYTVNDILDLCWFFILSSYSYTHTLLSPGTILLSFGIILLSSKTILYYDPPEPSIFPSSKTAYCKWIIVFPTYMFVSWDRFLCGFYGYH